MKLLELLNPVPGLKDFVQELARPRPYRLQILLLAAAATIVTFSALWDDFIAPPRAPEITYITTFSPDRTREEIIASNSANPKHKDELAAQQAEGDRKVREVYRTLGRMSGMDVDKIEREAAAERAAEARASDSGASAANLPAPKNPPDARGQN